MYSELQKVRCIGTRFLTYYGGCKKDQILMAFGPDLLVNLWNKPFSISSSLPLHFCSIQSMTGPSFHTAFSHCWRWNWLCIAHCKLSDDTQHCKLHIWRRIGKTKSCLEYNVKIKFLGQTYFIFHGKYFAKILISSTKNPT